MDSLSRLNLAGRALLVCLGLVLAATQAWAQQVCYLYRIQNPAQAGSYYTGGSPEQACQAYIASRPTTQTAGLATYTYEYQLKGINGGPASGSCEIEVTTTYCYNNNCQAPSKSPQRPGWTRIQIDCAPEQPQCQADAPVPSSDGVWQLEGITGSGNTMCSDGCEVSGQMAAEKDGSTYIWGPLTKSGKQCTPGNGGTPTGEQVPQSGDTPGSDQPDPNKCPGQVNGVTVQVACDKTWSAPQRGEVTKTEQKADGTTDTVKTEVKTETKCEGTTCVSTTTKTTTTTNSGGGTPVVESESSKQVISKSEYCKSNSGDAQCGNGSSSDGAGLDDEEEDPSSFGGACGAGFQCDGDAIQCAIAREQHQRNCAFYDETSAQAQEAKTAMAAGTRPAGHPGNSPTEFSLANGFDQTDIVGGTCPGDVMLNVPFGGSVVIPFSELCEPAQMLGQVLVGITALACIGIVFVGRNGGV